MRVILGLSLLFGPLGMACIGLLAFISSE